MFNHFEAALKSRDSALRNAREKMATLLKGHLLPEFTYDIAAEVAAYRNAFRTRLDELNIFNLPLPNISVQILFERDIAHRKPFKPNGEGMRDALIWESVMQITREDHSWQIALITNDQAFMDSSKTQLDPDLLEDLGASVLEAQGMVDPVGLQVPQLVPDQSGLAELHTSIQQFNEDWQSRIGSTEAR